MALRKMVMAMMAMGIVALVAGDGNSSVIRIGALVGTQTDAMGRVARRAIELAAKSVNENPSLLPGRLLQISFFYPGTHPLHSAAAVAKLLEEEVVAIVGPQSSSGSHFIAHMATETLVPILAFGVTNPAMSEYQYPYFFRISHRDTEQMLAVASFIAYYGWKQVGLLYSDGDYGANVAASLRDALLQKGSRLAHKVAIGGQIDEKGALRYLRATGLRVFVVHMQQPIDGINLLKEAKELGLMGKDLVWIVTDMISITLCSAAFSKTGTVFDGLVGTRAYIPMEIEPKGVLPYRNKHGDGGNAYALYAYDCVQIIARAIDVYLKKGGKLEFEELPRKLSLLGGGGELAKLKKLKSGPALREEILGTRLHGLSGLVEMNKRGDRKACGFEFINMVEKNVSVVGLWKSRTTMHLSKRSHRDRPNKVNLDGYSPSSNNSIGTIWIGGDTRIPRGYMFPVLDRPFRIGVPRKAGFNELVNETCDPEHPVEQCNGFCIEVFKSALSHLPATFPYIFVPYGNESFTPIYDELIQFLADKVYDMVVGDVFITPERLKIVDFTPPYIGSDLVILSPEVSLGGGKTWNFLRPFSMALWLSTAAVFLFVGFTMWALEHQTNAGFRGRPRDQLVTAVLFIYATLFLIQVEETKSGFGRAVLILWFFVVLIIQSSYTASLTAILTGQQFQPTVQDFPSLVSSSTPIGYQMGSFVRDYLISVGVNPERLKPLESEASYISALSRKLLNGGVSAIVDESPYANLFVSAYPKGFAIKGTRRIEDGGGWGFAFPKDSPLTSDMSEAILNMTQSGELREIHDKWFQPMNINNDADNAIAPLGLNSFWSLFLISGLASLICLTIYIGLLCFKFRRHGKDREKSPSHSTPLQNLSPPPSSLPPASFRKKMITIMKGFAAFVDESSKGKAHIEP